MLPAMKPRHAAALALVGWYLMIAPPQVQQGSVIGADLLAPLSQWANVHAFETADQCEADKSNYRSQVATNANVPPAYKDAIVASGLSLQCVASDDPRLGK